MHTLAIALVLVAGLDVGGHVGASFPVGALSRYHSSSAILGASVGYSARPFRIQVGYDYLSLPGVADAPYRASIHHVFGSGGFEFFRKNDWGFEVTLGAGYGTAERRYLDKTESGNIGSGQIGLNFVQRVGQSRLSAGLAQAVLVEALTGGTLLVATSQLTSMRAGVGYVF